MEQQLRRDAQLRAASRRRPFPGDAPPVPPPTMTAAAAAAAAALAHPQSHPFQPQQQPHPSHPNAHSLESLEQHQYPHHSHHQQQQQHYSQQHYSQQPQRHYPQQQQPQYPQYSSAHHPPRNDTHPQQCPNHIYPHKDHFSDDILSPNGVRCHTAAAGNEASTNNSTRIISTSPLTTPITPTLFHPPHAHATPPPPPPTIRANTIDHAIDPNTTPAHWAAAARSEWRDGGPGHTQSGEERRLFGDNTSTPPPHFQPGCNNTNGSSSRLAVRMVGACQRTDPAGAAYTAYAIQVWHPHSEAAALGSVPPSYPSTTTTTTTTSSSSPTEITVERRYSEFLKLHAQLASPPPLPNGSSSNSSRSNSNTTVSGSPFPSKHWAGRLGDWTPARVWAPAQHASLIDRRLRQLDAWLVDVVVRFHQSTAATTDASATHTHDCDRYYMSTRSQRHPDEMLCFSPSQQQAVLDFLTQPQLPPPCGQRQCSPRNNSNINTSTTTGSPSLVSSASASLHWHNPVTFTLGSAIRQATATVVSMCHFTDHNNNNSNALSQKPTTSQPPSIPVDLLQVATGLVFLTVVKAGVVFSGRVGTGLLIAKHPPSNANDRRGGGGGGWSAPVAVGTVGMGWGALVGGEVTHSLIVLTTAQAVADFGKANATVHLGAEVGGSVGPLGRTAAQQLHHAAGAPMDWTLHSAYAYAISSGLFIGVSLEGSVIHIRKDVNAKFYGRNVSVAELLQAPGVPAAESLYEALNAAMEVSLPETAFRPSRIWQNNNNNKPDAANTEWTPNNIIAYSPATTATTENSGRY